MTETGATPTPQPAPTPEVPKPLDPGAEIRRPDLQMLLQDLASSQRTLFEERRHAERRLAEERERSRWEQERIRTELLDRLKDSERQNDVLVRSLGRLQSENEKLREQIAFVKADRRPPASTESPKGDAPAAAPVPMGPSQLLPAVAPMAGSSSRIPVVARELPAVGKPVRLTEPPGMPAGSP